MIRYPALVWCLSTILLSASVGWALQPRLTTTAPASPQRGPPGMTAATTTTAASPSYPTSLSRRQLGNEAFVLIASVGSSIASGAATTATLVLLNPAEAGASGGATAGKYTTIPIAKRRYYGRVQQGVHEFLAIGLDVIKGDMTVESVQRFFDPEGAVVFEGRRSSDIRGQCTKKDGDCRKKQVLDSRYNDMKTSMYLLANAFRSDQQKFPDRLPTVKAAKAYFTQMDALEKRVRDRPKANDPEAVRLYATALSVLDQYLDLVELPPTDSGHYDQEFDTLVGESARLT